jgi:nucleosome binding factor SPN SPT16 subunit
MYSFFNIICSDISKPFFALLSTIRFQSPLEYTSKIRFTFGNWHLNFQLIYKPSAGALIIIITLFFSNPKLAIQRHLAIKVAVMRHYIG